MSMLTELIDRLEADAGVGAIAGDRIYPDVLPRDVTYPAVSYTRVSDEPSLLLSSTEGWSFARVSFSLWSPSRLVAWNLAEAVKSSLSNYRGTLSTVRVSIRQITESDSQTPALGTDDELDGIYRTIQDYRIGYERT